MKPILGLFDDNELELICKSIHNILEKKGVRFTVPGVLSYFKENGFKITNGDVVHITFRDLETALKTVPKKFVRKGANELKNVEIGNGISKFALGSIPLYVIETIPNLKRRPANYEDFKNFTILSETLDAYEIGNPVVWPKEIPEGIMHIVWNRNVSVRMTKPSCCWYAKNFKVAEEGFEILRLAAGGLKELCESPRWAISIVPDSALEYGGSAIGVVTHAKGNQLIDVVPMQFQGAVHPVTMAGTIVQSAVETLAIVVLSQLVKPGCPVLYSPSLGGMLDMSTGNYSFGGPEAAFFAAASAIVGKAFGLPTNMMQGYCDSKIPDQQAAIEKTLTYTIAALAGADCITQAGAILEFGLSASYEQLIIEDEIIKWVKKIASGAIINKETLAEEEIMNLPFGGSHLSSEFTLEHFKKELFFSKIADRRSWASWYNDGAKDMVERAHERLEEIFSTQKPALGITERNKLAVDEFAAEYFRKYGVDPEKILY